LCRFADAVLPLANNRDTLNFAEEIVVEEAFDDDQHPGDLLHHPGRRGLCRVKDKP